jgi:hypothetical protein
MLTVFGSSVRGQYSIDWSAIAGGGGTSTGGVYSVSGTIGQPDAGVAMKGGAYSLTGGFWSLISMTQTTFAPKLYISHSGDNMTLYWQAVSGWALGQKNSLAPSVNWSSSSAVTTANGTNYLTIPNSPGAMFYRLQSQ